MRTNASAPAPSVDTYRPCLALIELPTVALPAANQALLSLYAPVTLELPKVLIVTHRMNKTVPRMNAQMGSTATSTIAIMYCELLLLGVGAGEEHEATPLETANALPPKQVQL